MNPIELANSRLVGIDWFSRCGNLLPSSLPFDSLAVSNWNDAIAFCGDEHWDRVTIDARNALTGFLSANHREEDRRWNQIVSDAKTLLSSGPWQKMEKAA